MSEMAFAMAMGAVLVLSYFWCAEERSHAKHMKAEAEFWRDMYQAESQSTSASELIKFRQVHELVCTALRKATGASSIADAIELVDAFEKQRIDRCESVHVSEDDVDTCEIDIVRCDTEEAK